MHLLNANGGLGYATINQMRLPYARGTDIEFNIRRVFTNELETSRSGPLWLSTPPPLLVLSKNREWVADRSVSSVSTHSVHESLPGTTTW